MPETQQQFTVDDKCFEAGDGTRLAYYLWHRKAASDCRALVLILHGIGYHARPYEVVARSMKIEGATFAALDLRGHGRSAGNKGELPPITKIVQDIGDWVEHMQASFLGVPTFLVAESMSGPFGTLYTLERPGSIDGLILAAPAVLPGWRQLVIGESLNAMASAATSPNSPTIDLSGKRLRMGSNNDVFPEMRTNDPDAMQAVSPQYMLRIGEAIARLMARRSLATKTPVLILHGDGDKVLSPLGSRVLFQRIKSPDKNLMIIPGANHTLFWDQASSAVFTIMDNWIEGRLP